MASIARSDKGKTQIIKHFERSKDADPLVPLAYDAISKELKRGNGKLGLEYLKLKGDIVQGQGLTRDVTINVAIANLLPTQPGESASTGRTDPSSREVQGGSFTHTPPQTNFSSQAPQLPEIIDVKIEAPHAVDEKGDSNGSE